MSLLQRCYVVVTLVLLTVFASILSDRPGRLTGTNSP